MKSLEKHRRMVVGETNSNLRILYGKPQVEAVHDFRVGVKRLTALYRFLSGIQPAIDSKSILRTHRMLFKSLGRVREGHITLELLAQLPESNPDHRKRISGAVRKQVNRDLRRFRSLAVENGYRVPRLPGIASLGVPENAVFRHRRRVLKSLISEVCYWKGRPSVEQWHRKRIQLKTHRYILEAFRFTPGHEPDEENLRQIKMVEQLLGDWHDRITTMQYLRNLEGVGHMTSLDMEMLDKQRTALLASAKIYIAGYAVRNGIVPAGGR